MSIRKRTMRRETPALYTGMLNEQIPVKATTTTIGVETRPAETAASPMTRAPTILMAGPMARGIRSPASRRISKVTSIKKASRKVGKGIPSRAAAMVRSNGVGIISW